MFCYGGGGGGGGGHQYHMAAMAKRGNCTISSAQQIVQKEITEWDLRKGIDRKKNSSYSLRLAFDECT